MSYYDDSSLFVAPNGYKASVLFAQKPMDANGQLAFTRSNDTATRVASNGLIEKVRTNLLLQSNTFSTTWLNTDTTETGGQAGYDGTNNAWLLTKTAANANIYQTVVATGLLTQSIYAKAGTLNWFVMNNSGVSSTGVYFDLQNGVIGNVGANVVSSKIEAVGNGWYRCSLTFNGTSSAIRIYPAEGNNNISGSSGNILIQAAQFESGDIMTDYIPTSTAAVSVGPLANIPRINYLGGGCGKLLLEPQRQNLALFSESFDNAGWTKAGSTITANSATSPDGYTNADRIVETATTATHLVLQSVALTAATHTFSCFIKAVSGSTRNVGLLFNSTGRGVLVNPSNGAVVAYFGTTTASNVEIKTYPNGWYRVSVTATTAAITESMRIYLGNGTTWTSVYAGDGTSSALIWGAQLEAGAYATSYIPTLAASVTRGADAVSLKNITSFGIGNSYTLFFELNLNSLDSNKLFYETRNSSGTTSFTIRNFSGGFRAYNNIDSAYPFAAVYGSNNKYVLRVDGTSYSVFYASSGTPTKQSASITTARNFGYFVFDGVLTNWLFDQHLIFPTALSDAQCLELVS